MCFDHECENMVGEINIHTETSHAVFQIYHGGIALAYLRFNLKIIEQCNLHCAEEAHVRS